MMSTPIRSHQCQKCDLSFILKNNLQRHIASIHSGQLRALSNCTNVYDRADTLLQHKRMIHTVPTIVTASGSDPISDIIATEAINNDSDSIDIVPDYVRQKLRDHWDALKTHDKKGRHISVYNFFHRPDTVHPIDWASLLTPIYQRQRHPFSINLSHHLILRHKETDELRFFHASSNNAGVLPSPVLIACKDDLYAFLSLLSESDILDTACQSRPNTKYSVELVPATSFYLYHLPGEVLY